jgi:tetratricopeptide (TPR) repeat protein
MNITLQGLLIGCLMASLAYKTEKTVVEFSPTCPEKEKVARQRKNDAALQKGYQLDEQAKRIEDLFARANVLSLDEKKTSIPKMQQITGVLQSALSTYLEQSGKLALKKLSLYLLAKFEEKLSALSQACSSVEGAATALLKGAPVLEQVLKPYQEFVRVGGGFLILAAQNGLLFVGKNGAIEMKSTDRFVIQVAYKVYLAKLIPEALNPMPLLLTKFERYWYEKWVVERSVTASLQRKLWGVRTLKSNHPDYPDGFAQGVVYYRAKKYKEAVAAFERAVKNKPNDKTLKKFLTQAKRQTK